MKTTDYLQLRSGHIAIKGNKRFCFHKYNLDEVKVLWRYRQCSKCNKRLADTLSFNVYSPLDWNWLYTGEWTKEPTEPPGEITSSLTF
jgi:hypothetical protein